MDEYDQNLIVNDSYFRNMLSFAKYASQNSDIDFSTHYLFLTAESNDQHFIQAKATTLFFGKEYGNDFGETIADIYHSDLIWNGYTKYYTTEELTQFISFAKKCGVQSELTIIEQRAWQNPQYCSKLYSDGKESSRCKDSDYTIFRLQALINMKSIDINRQIWNCLRKYGVKNPCPYTMAEYSPNGKTITRSCDSTLVYLLKHESWIPNIHGELFKPEDILLKEIHPSFIYETNNKLLDALQIGSAYAGQIKKKALLEQEAKEQGLHLITDDEFELLKTAIAQREATRKAELASSCDLLDRQEKRAKPSINEGDDFSPDGSVRNSIRREKNIEATFKNAEQMKPVQRKLFGKNRESTKEERNKLFNWYQGKCQMCDTIIIGADRKPHFIARNIINTRDLSDRIRNTTDISWNSLCLCPNCATKYNVCTRDLSGFYDQIMNTPIIEGSAEAINLSIELDNRIQIIKYVPRHFLALKKVLQLIDEEFADINEQ